MQIRLVIVIIIILISMFKIYAQEEWYVIYDNAIKDIEKGKYENAIYQLEYLIDELKRSNPALNEPTYADYRINYTPYFYLGKAYLFSMQYDKALKYFQESEKYNVIRDTDEYSNFLTLKYLAQTLISFIEKEEEPQDLFRKDLLSLIKNGRYEEALIKLNERFKIIDVKKDKEIRIKEAKIDTLEKFKELFYQSLENYLRRDYRTALEILLKLSENEPDNYHITKWIDKINSELNRFERARPQNQDSIYKKILVFQTARPVFAISSPDSDIVVTRSNKILISGKIADDKGIKNLQVNLNGKNYEKNVKLQPTSEEDSTEYSFKLEIPLEIGDNEITLVAYDIDSVQHDKNCFLFVTRRRPISKEPFFYSILIGFLVIVIGGYSSYKFAKRHIAYMKGFNPYIVGDPIRKESMFFGREEILKEIENTIHNNHFVIIGPRRIGKTSIQYQIKRILEKKSDEKYYYIPVLVDLQGVSEEKFFFSMMENILQGCQKYLNNINKLDLEFFDKDSYDNIKFSRDLDKIMTKINNRNDKELRLVLLIDEIDVLNNFNDTIRSQLRQIFQKTFAQNLKAIMTGVNIKKVDIGSDLYNICLMKSVSLLKQDECESLIKSPVKGIFSYEDSAIEKIIKNSKCRPFYTQAYCFYAINKIIKEKRRIVTVEDIEVVRKQVLKYARWHTNI